MSTYLSRAAEKLRAQHDQAHILTVFLSQDRYDTRVPPPYTRSATLTLPASPTADMLQLLAYARRMLEKLYEPGRRYIKAGVVLDGLELPGRVRQFSLFAPADTATSRPAATPESDARARQLMHSLDALNRQFGRGTVRPAASVAPPAATGQPTAPWLGRAEHRSSAYTTRLEELLIIS